MRVSSGMDDPPQGPPTIGFLHTARAHVDTFRRLVEDEAPGVASVAVVDDGALARARLDGPDHPEVQGRIATGLAGLEAAGAHVVVCTCSTIGNEAERLGARSVLPTFRVDRPMAEAAVAAGPRIAVLATLESTLRPTTDLLRSVAGERGAVVAITQHLVAGAWERYEAGDIPAFLEAVAGACAALDTTGVDAVVLAQASMAGAAGRVALDVPVLTSPRPAVRAAAAAARAACSGPAAAPAAGRR
jgi:aspartate/glutamate racemase